MPLNSVHFAHQICDELFDFWTTPRRRGNAPCRSRYAALGSGSSNRASCGGTWTLGGSSSLLYKAWISTV